MVKDGYADYAEETDEHGFKLFTKDLSLNQGEALSFTIFFCVSA